MKKCLLVVLMLCAASCRSSSNNGKHPDDPQIVDPDPNRDSGQSGCLKAHPTWGEAINADDNNESLATVFVNPESEEAKLIMKKVRDGNLNCKEQP